MGNKNKYVTGFLFSTPNFISGAGTVMNIAGNYYDFNSSETGLEADAMAIKNDFNMIGQDMKDVLNTIKTN